MFIRTAGKMSQKVWIINENYKRSASGVAGGIISSFHRDVKQKNPALAYSLSLLIWGCGHLYIRRWKSGVPLFLFMIMFYLSMIMIVKDWTAIVSILGSLNVSRSETLLVFVFFYLAGLIIWHFNSCHAYFRTIKMNNTSFKGVKSIFLPAACSLLMPGWGQFLNGQPKKGICFQIFSLTGLFAFPAILIVFLFWPILEVSQARLMVEWIFTISLIFTPFIVMLWLFSVYDAARVSADNIKKEPLRKRIRYQINRYRHGVQVYGWKNAILPIIKRIVIVILLLTIVVVSYHHIPKRYYKEQLMDLGSRISQEGMTVIPGLINYFCDNIPS
jgi:TM2 domain-containing membrane protein YozV